MPQPLRAGSGCVTRGAGRFFLLTLTLLVFSPLGKAPLLRQLRPSLRMEKKPVKELSRIPWEQVLHRMSGDIDAPPTAHHICHTKCLSDLLL